ncbi:MAG: hypothetical protein FJ197_00970 [Gammaproteobacteria bacterium]|nr:hypothetical protein [Gammaproteobacteria bacterium]
MNQQRSIRNILIALVICAAIAGLSGGCSSDEPEAGSSINVGKKDAQSEQGDATTAADPGAAVALNNIDLGACLRAMQGEETGVECPGFIASGLPDLDKKCSEAGGTLEPRREPVGWTIELDGSGEREALIDLAENFYCSGAPAVFSCGSQGCPLPIYAKLGEDWFLLGAVNPGDALNIEVLPAVQGQPYRELRGGCNGQRPCDELTHYSWQGGYYDRRAIEVRGHWVEVMPGGMRLLAADTALRAAPAEDAATVDQYPAGLPMAVVGKARDADYFYVSPCTACASGFVAAAGLQPEE